MAKASAVVVATTSLWLGLMNTWTGNTYMSVIALREDGDEAIMLQRFRPLQRWNDYSQETCDHICQLSRLEEAKKLLVKAALAAHDAIPGRVGKNPLAETGRV